MVAISSLVIAATACDPVSVVQIEQVPEGLMSRTDFVQVAHRIRYQRQP
jgi:hypothetical protein